MEDIAHKAMAEHGFLSFFPHRVLRELESVRDLSQADKIPEDVEDLRDLLWSSVDNLDTQDFDQLEFCERRARNEIRVLIAVADVDSYVSKASHIDRYAYHNGTSVYTGVITFPMLPEKLCNDISSLKENADRLAVVLEYFVRPDGSVRFGDVFRALVKNKAKLVYESLGDWLEGGGPEPEPLTKIAQLKEQIHLQDEAAGRLHDLLVREGMIELETIEASPVIEHDTIVDLTVRKKNRARQIIENFMITANRAMVHFLQKHDLPFIQRVVRTPKRWSRIIEVAQALGHRLPVEPDPKSLSEFLDKQKIKDPVRFPDLSLTVVKLLGYGEYVMTEAHQESFGHFGLAVRDYTHSTAPNRRYIDIIMQRLLKTALAKEKLSYTKKELGEISFWCTDRDQTAKKVERFMRKVEGAVLLQDRLGETFEGIITGASEKGTYVRLLNPSVEGRIVRNEAGLDVGQTVRVRLIRMIIEKGFIDFEKMG